MGAVYLALQLSTGRKRALKVLSPSLLHHDRLREQFIAEARVAAELDSDHIADVVASGVDTQTGAPWFATEYLEGETLKARVQRSGRLPPAEVAEIVRQTCHAMSHAHAAGLVHRDLKPANLFVADPRRDGVLFTVKVLDFGIAKLVQDGHLASTSAPIGSPLWMAPEQCVDHRALPATDVWALGLIAYYCVVGRAFWRSDGSQSMPALLAEVLNDEIPPASLRAREHGMALPAGFDEWFARCVARDPARRFPDARHALDALAAWASGSAEPLPALPPAPVPSGPRTWSAEPFGVPGDTQVTQPPTWNANGPPSSIRQETTDGTFRPLMPQTASGHAARVAGPRPWLWLGGAGALALAGFLLVGALGAAAHLSGALPALGLGSNDDAQPSAPAATAAPLEAPTASAVAEPEPEPRSKSKSKPVLASRKPPASAPSAQPAPAPAAEPAAGPTAAGLGGFRGLVLNCWHNNEGASAASPASVSVTLRVDGGGIVRSVRVDDSAAFPNLRRCVVTQGTSYRGFTSPPPSWSMTTFSVSLPAAK